MRVASQYPGWVIRITGPITASDTGQLRSFQAQNDPIHCYEPGYCPFRNVLLRNSAGDDPAKDPEGVEWYHTAAFYGMNVGEAWLLCAETCRGLVEEDPESRKDSW